MQEDSRDFELEPASLTISAQNISATPLQDSDVRTSDLEASATSSQPVPFRSFTSYLREICSLSLVVVMCLSICLSVTIYVLAATHRSNIHDLFQVCVKPGDCTSAPWKGLATANIVIMSVLLMVQGCRAEFILIAAVVVLGLLQIVPLEKALSGFSNSGNLIVQAFFVLIRGVQDSGVLDRIFSMLLGNPGGRYSALLRAQVVAVVLSAFVSQGPVVLAGRSTLQAWGLRVGLSSRELQMPFCCAANMGQTMLLVSSAVSIIIGDKMKEARLDMFDPILGCVALSAFTCVFGAVFSGPLLKNTVGVSTEPLVLNSNSDVDLAASSRYVIDFKVDSKSMLLGRSPEQAGLCLQSGVDLLGDESLMQTKLQADDVLCFAASAAGVARLRRVGHGLLPTHVNPIESLGGRRHQRRLFEASLGPGSPLIGSEFPVALPRAKCLAMRRPSIMSGLNRWNRPQFGTLQVGDILLIEGFDDFPSLLEVRQLLIFVATVPDSAPPRHGRSLDVFRGWCAALALVIVLLLSMFQVADLTFLAMAACVACVCLNVVHRDTVLQALNLPVYLIIAGGVGVGEAMQSSGLANALAQTTVGAGNAVTGGSAVGSLVAVAIVTGLVSNLMSSTATAALMVSIVSQIARTEHVNPKSAALLLIYATTSAVCTPFATGGAVLIKDAGPYVFADYFRYGFPLQLSYLVIIPFFCCLVYGVSPAQD